MCEKLRDLFASLAGKAGFEALLSRVLKLGKKELPRLEPLRPKRDGCFEGLADIHPPLTEQELVEAEIVLVSYVVELLSTFLGEALLLRLIHDVWPDAAFKDIDPVKEPVA